MTRRITAVLPAMRERNLRLPFVGQSVSLLGSGMVGWRWRSPCSTSLRAHAVEPRAISGERIEASGGFRL